MAKVTLNKVPTATVESPSAQLVRQAAAEVKVTDARGRVITLRKPTVLAQFRFVEGMGDAASNRGYMAMAFPLLYVAAIDETDEPALAKKSMLEALVQRLDEDGLDAVTKGIQEHFGEAMGPEEAKKK